MSREEHDQILACGESQFNAIPIEIREENRCWNSDVTRDELSLLSSSCSYSYVFSLKKEMRGPRPSLESNFWDLDRLRLPGWPSISWACPWLTRWSSHGFGFGEETSR